MIQIRNKLFSFTHITTVNRTIMFSFGGTRLYNGVPTRNITRKYNDKILRESIFQYVLIAISINIAGRPKAKE